VGRVAHELIPNSEKHVLIRGTKEKTRHLILSFLLSLIREYAGETKKLKK